MKKIEFVYRDILYQAIEKNNRRITQIELAKKLKISLSTVNYALSFLRKMGAIKVNLRNLEIIDIKKILYYWASIRNLKKDITYSTRVDKSVKDIESEMPNNVIFGGYSAYKFRYKDLPADYSEVYVYGNHLEKRFPKNDNKANLFVLKKDELMEGYGKLTTVAQTFVDLWNLREWYAKEFLKDMEDKLGRFLE